MKKKKSKKSNIGTIIFVIIFVAILALLVKTFYGMITNDNTDTSDGKRTEVQKLLDKNFDQSYPATEREVVKIYCRIMKEMYSGECSDENIQGLFAQMRKLYDEELLSENSYDKQYKALKKELNSYKKAKKKIVNYAIEESEDVEKGEYEGQEQALVDVVLSIKEDSEWQHVGEQFVLRQDEEGRWKILGWHKIETSVGEKNE